MVLLTETEAEDARMGTQSRGNALGGVSRTSSQRRRTKYQIQARLMQKDAIAHREHIVRELLVQEVG